MIIKQCPFDKNRVVVQLDGGRRPPPPGALNRYAVNYYPMGELGFRRRGGFFRAISKTVEAATGRPLPGTPPPPPTSAPTYKPGMPYTGTQPVTIAVPGGRTPPLPPGGGLRSQTPGQAAALAVKEYADVSAYRNILDMLQTFQGVLNRWGQSLATELRCVNNQGIVSCKKAPQNPNIEERMFSSIGASGSGCFLMKATGYAASKIGPKNKAEARIYADQQIKAAGVPAGDPGFFEVPDLLNLARTINYEMNRVRLPIPHNFRQINNAIQGRDYRLCQKWHREFQGLPAVPDYETWRKSNFMKQNIAKQWDQVLSSHYINAVELLPVYKQLKTAVNAMRVGVRKEIDAANLAAKVEEQTIRAEQEALISRQQAAENAQKRELEILAEKKAQYEKDMAEAEKMRAEMAKTTADMQAELEQLAAAREAAQTDLEVQAVEEKAAEVATAAELAAQMERDYTTNLQTTAAAAGGLQDQIRTVQYEQAAGREQAAAEGIPTTKPGLPAPLILTAAAGLLLL